MFKGFFGGIDGSGIPKIKTKRCPICSTSFDDIINSCKVGCGECYNTFRDEIESAVRKIQPSAGHKGKIPNGASPQLKKESELEKLSEKLKKAVANEEYEQAAKIRDEIKKLRGEE
jgi:protein arginine kinase activator